MVVVVMVVGISLPILLLLCVSLFASRGDTTADDEGGHRMADWLLPSRDCVSVCIYVYLG